MFLLLQKYGNEEGGQLNAQQKSKAQEFYGQFLQEQINSISEKYKGKTVTVEQVKKELDNLATIGTFTEWVKQKSPTGYQNYVLAITQEESLDKIPGYRDVFGGEKPKSLFERMKDGLKMLLELQAYGSVDKHLESSMKGLKEKLDAWRADKSIHNQNAAISYIKENPQAAQAFLMAARLSGNFALQSKANGADSYGQKDFLSILSDALPFANQFGAKKQFSFMSHEKASAPFKAKPEVEEGRVPVQSQARGDRDYDRLWVQPPDSLVNNGNKNYVETIEKYGEKNDIPTSKIAAINSYTINDMYTDLEDAETLKMQGTKFKRLKAMLSGAAFRNAIWDAKSQNGNYLFREAFDDNINNISFEYVLLKLSPDAKSKIYNEKAERKYAMCAYVLDSMLAKATEEINMDKILLPIIMSTLGMSDKVSWPAGSSGPADLKELLEKGLRFMNIGASTTEFMSRPDLENDESRGGINWYNEADLFFNTVDATNMCYRKSRAYASIPPEAQRYIEGSIHQVSRVSNVQPEEAFSAQSYSLNDFVQEILLDSQENSPRTNSAMYQNALKELMGMLSIAYVKLNEDGSTDVKKNFTEAEAAAWDADKTYSKFYYINKYEADGSYDQISYLARLSEYNQWMRKRRKQNADDEEENYPTKKVWSENKRKILFIGSDTKSARLEVDQFQKPYPEGVGSVTFGYRVKEIASWDKKTQEDITVKSDTYIYVFNGQNNNAEEGRADNPNNGKLITTLKKKDKDGKEVLNFSLLKNQNTTETMQQVHDGAGNLAFGEDGKPIYALVVHSKTGGPAGGDVYDISTNLKSTNEYWIYATTKATVNKTEIMVGHGTDAPSFISNSMEEKDAGTKLEVERDRTVKMTLTFGVNGFVALAAKDMYRTEVEKNTEVRIKPKTAMVQVPVLDKNQQPVIGPDNKPKTRSVVDYDYSDGTFFLEVLESALPDKFTPQVYRRDIDINGNLTGEPKPTNMILARNCPMVGAKIGFDGKIGGKKQFYLCTEGADIAVDVDENSRLTQGTMSTYNLIDKNTVGRDGKPVVVGKVTEILDASGKIKDISTKPNVDGLIDHINLSIEKMEETGVYTPSPYANYIIRTTTDENGKITYNEGGEYVPGFKYTQKRDWVQAGFALDTLSRTFTQQAVEVIEALSSIDELGSWKLDLDSGPEMWLTMKAVPGKPGSYGLIYKNEDGEQMEVLKATKKLTDEGVQWDIKEGKDYEKFIKMKNQRPTAMLDGLEWIRPIRMYGDWGFGVA